MIRTQSLGSSLLTCRFLSGRDANCFYPAEGLTPKFVVLLPVGYFPVLSLGNFCASVSFLVNRDNNSAHLIGLLCGLNEICHVKHSEKRLVNTQ